MIKFMKGASLVVFISVLCLLFSANFSLSVATSHEGGGDGGSYGGGGGGYDQKPEVEPPQPNGEVAEIVCNESDSVVGAFCLKAKAEKEAKSLDVMTNKIEGGFEIAFFKKMDNMSGGAQVDPATAPASGTPTAVSSSQSNMDKKPSVGCRIVSKSSVDDLKKLIKDNESALSSGESISINKLVNEITCIYADDSSSSSSSSTQTKPNVFKVNDLTNSISITASIADGKLSIEAQFKLEAMSEAEIAAMESEINSNVNTGGNIAGSGTTVTAIGTGLKYDLILIGTSNFGVKFTGIDLNKFQSFAEMGVAQAGDSGAGTVETETDTDGDGVLDDVDNCPKKENQGQEDEDGDGVGDECTEDDDDEDGFNNKDDNCPWDKNADQKDRDNNGVGDECEESEEEGDGSSEASTGGASGICGGTTDATTTPSSISTRGNPLLALIPMISIIFMTYLLRVRAQRQKSRMSN